MTDSTTREVVKNWLNELPADERAALITEVTTGTAQGGEGDPPVPTIPSSVADGKALYERMGPRGNISVEQNPEPYFTHGKR